MRLQKSSTVKRFGVGMAAAALLITSACAAKVNQYASSSARCTSAAALRHPRPPHAPAARRQCRCGFGAAPASSGGAAASVRAEEDASGHRHLFRARSTWR